MLVATFVDGKISTLRLESLGFHGNWGLFGNNNGMLLVVVVVVVVLVVVGRMTLILISPLSVHPEPLPPPRTYDSTSQLQNPLSASSASYTRTAHS